MNKRGIQRIEVLSLILSILVIVLLFFHFLEISPWVQKLRTNIAGSIVYGIFSVLYKVITFLFKLVVPSSALTNYEYSIIAFGLFLIMFVVSFYSLESSKLFNSFASLLIAFFISFVGTRGLTDKLIENYIIGSSAQAMLFLFAVIPILWVFGYMKRWNKGSVFTKIVAWGLFSIISFLVFQRLVKNEKMGLIVTIGIIILAAVEIITSALTKRRKTTTP